MLSPSDNILTYKGSLTLQDTIDLNYYRELSAIRPGIRFALYLLAIGFAFGAICSFFSVGFNVPGIFMVAFSTCILGSSFLSRLYIWSRYKRNPIDFIETTVKISPTSVHLNNKNIDITLPWSQIFSVYDTPQGLLLLYRAGAPLCWLPKRLFIQNDFRQQLLQYACAASTPVKKYS